MRGMCGTLHNYVLYVSPSQARTKQSLLGLTFIEIQVVPFFQLRLGFEDKDIFDSVVYHLKV